ncbi:MAG: MarR family winged helix-turn-helix transcriptional regulator [Hominenteromicrobium sp.]
MMADNNEKNAELLADFPRHLSRSITFLHRQRKKFMNERMKQYGFIGAMYMILLHIARNPGTTQDAIVSHMYIDKCNVARRTKRLEELGYIRRETGKTDRRENNLYLTEAGEALVPEIRGYLREWAQSVTRDLSDEERLTLITLLDRLIHTDVE